MPRFSIRALLAFVLISAIFLALGLEYGGMVRADGGGRQKVNVALARPKEIRNIRWTAVNATFVNADGHEVAFANSDGHRWDEHWELEFVRPRSLIRVDQQWSFTEMGFTKRRLRYTQTYDNIVLHIEFKNGGSDQKVVELAKFGEPVSVDIP